ncbi:DM13 domain-containing protein [Membranihabitans marinus]|uniref:DM13 domain-containing protein n=1 Tax=Membranihabitans marinus TaxID=1227546 RepID=UPI001F466197|nr:DM13 domain-containing protein [Membranihabitans marinus]
MKYSLLLLSLLAIFSCVGTDYTEEALILNQASVKLSPEIFNITIGQDFQISAEVKNIKGEVITTEVDWTSTQPTVATVNESGLVTAVAEGTTFIIAQYEDELNGLQIDSSQITVIQDNNNQGPIIGGIAITSEIATLIPGGTALFKAIVRSTTGIVLNETVVWKSSDPAVASIDNNGKATAHAAGETKITAEIDGIVSNEFPLAVKENLGYSGSFVGKTGHRVSGSVVVSADSKTLTLQEDFSTQSGPGLQIYLSKSADSGSGGIDLGAIKSNSGTQTYTIPDGVKVSDYKFVLVYCKPFSVVFGAAELK